MTVAVTLVTIQLMCKTTLPYTYIVHLKLLKNEGLARLPKVLKKQLFYSLNLNVYLISILAYVITVI